MQVASCNIQQPTWVRPERLTTGRVHITSLRQVLVVWTRVGKSMENPAEQREQTLLHGVPQGLEGAAPQ
jgi:hypothetical protein